MRFAAQRVTFGVDPQTKRLLLVEANAIDGGVEGAEIGRWRDDGDGLRSIVVPVTVSPADVCCARFIDNAGAAPERRHTEAERNDPAAPVME